MTSPTNALRPPRRRLALALVLLFSVAAGFLDQAPAAAVTGTGHGVGHLWRGDGVSWLGTYRLDDGTQAFCLEAGKTSPVGNHYDTTTGGDVIGVSTDDHARLAYIARTWGGTTDADTAAAGQLAVWTITGLNGHTQRYYAGRANERWPIVLERANQMLAEASSAASKSVVASITVELAADGTGLVRPDLTVDRVTGGPTLLEPSHEGTVTLDGAVFADGSTTTSVRNAESVPVTATGDQARLTVRATVRFDDLPYGRVTTVGNSPAGSQMILFSGGVAASASEAASVEQLSPLPFQPRVVTQTSDTVAETGTTVTDQVTLDVRPGEGLLSEWGRYDDAGTWRAVPVTVRSRLLGPFLAPVVESDDWPRDAPVVCEVALEVLDGPGTYSTPGCDLPSGGYYTWVETVDPADTPVEAGRDRVGSWRSPFGTATETTFVPWAPSVSTTVSEAEVDPGTCVSDSLTVADLHPDVPGGVEVESVLVGPFDDAPEAGSDLGPINRIDPSLVVAREAVVVGDDGTYDTPCITLDRPGTYVFVFSSAGSPAAEDGSQVVPAFADTTVHWSEMTTVRQSAPTEAPVVPARLAFTGSDGGGQALLVALGIVGTGVVLVASAGVLHVRRRRRSGVASDAASIARPGDRPSALGVGDAR
ncbi:thioester domain-containing protein [Frigoribacterium sp. Leaf186]|uniref:thioester domain-containing protein n=1 Tax=Frigoribacterium sp. Leaf186 TaxID=1736293 RepID=UPI000A3DA2BA|nr:thioester domain-containing protein [Frigoribacterium sp. Leaf186]